MSGHTEIYQDDKGEWRWRITAANGEIVAQGEGHTSSRDAQRALDTALDIAAQLRTTGS